MAGLRFVISRAHGKANVLDAAHRFCDVLSVRLRVQVKLHVSADYDKLYSDVVQRGMELAWMPPLLHARGVAEGVSIAAVSERSGALTYRSALAVLKDSPFQTLEDLRQARFAWNDRSSASGYLFPRLHLLGAGVRPANETFLGSVLACCTAVSDQVADVCAGHVSEAAANDAERALSDFALHHRAAAWRFRIIGVTESIPPDVIAFGPKIDPSLKPAVELALHQMHETEVGAEVIKDLLTATRLLPVTAGIRQTVQRAGSLVSVAEQTA